MKPLFLLIGLVMASPVLAQNEFAAQSFYNIFRKIKADADSGFKEYKGEPVKSQYPGLQEAYRVKLMIPLADSGRIMVPSNRTPYAVYYFEAEKKKDRIDQRAVHLRDALLTAWGKPLYARTTTSKVEDKIFSDTYLFDNPDEVRVSQALFRINVYYAEKQYRLLMEIRGAPLKE